MERIGLLGVDAEHLTMQPLGLGGVAGLVVTDGGLEQAPHVDGRFARRGSLPSLP